MQTSLININFLSCMVFTVQNLLLFTMQWGLKEDRVAIIALGEYSHIKILFSDNKVFTVEEISNRQNVRVYAKNTVEANVVAPRIQGGHHPASVMIYLRVP